MFSARSELHYYVLTVRAVSSQISDLFVNFDALKLCLAVAVPTNKAFYTRDISVSQILVLRRS